MLSYLGVNIDDIVSICLCSQQKPSELNVDIVDIDDIVSVSIGNVNKYFRNVYQVYSFLDIESVLKLNSYNRDHHCTSML